MENHMRFFLFLMLFSILKAAQILDTSPLLLPYEFKPWVDIFKDVVQVDSSGQSKKTLREVKAIMDPLKEEFNKYVTVKKLIELTKDFKPRLDEYIKEYEMKRDKEGELIRAERVKKFEEKRGTVPEDWYLIHLEYAKCSFIPDRDETEEYKRLTCMISSCYLITIFADFSTTDGSPLKLHRYPFSSPLITVMKTLRLPEEQFKSYFSIELQKMFFPVEMIAVLVCISITCDLCYEDCYRNKDGEVYSNTFDVSDKLDEPFLNAFNYMSKAETFVFIPELNQKVFEKLTFMLDHHVVFDNPKA
ncbi:MAG: hypothetical protein NEHIOOID_01257 [Holosporales bacterium]